MYKVWLEILSGFMLNETKSRSATFDTVADALEAGKATASPFRVVSTDESRDESRRVVATWSNDRGVRRWNGGHNLL